MLFNIGSTNCVRDSGIKMVESIYSYALFKTLYNKGQDCIDAFWPIVIRCIEENIIYDKKSILELLQKEYDMNMPIHVLESVLDRLIRRKFVRRSKKNSYHITGIGLEYKGSIVDVNDVERKINFLIDDIYKYNIDKGYSYSKKDINKMLLNIMNENITDLLEFINPSIIFDDIERQLDNKYVIIEKYVSEASEKKPEHYNIFREMVFGSLISAILYTKGYLDVLSISKPPLKNTTMYLDTNFIFSLFELHPQEYNEPIIELYNLMRVNEVKMKAFSFTLDEICRVLSGFLSVSHKYSTTIKVEDIYSIMKIRGWTDSDVKEFITNIDNLLNEKGIEIEWVPKHEVDYYKPANPNLAIKIFQYKPNININSMNHDLLALEKITKLRSRPLRRLDQAKEFFLTCDIKLNRFNMSEMGHRNNGTICETILDRTLTNLLWLKNPDSNPSLKVILSAHSSSGLVKKNIWDSVYKTLSQLKSRGLVNGNDIAMLFYDSYMEEILREMSDSEEYKIGQDFIIEHVEKARLIEGEIRQEIKEALKSEYDKLFDEKRLKIEDKKEQEIQEDWYKNILDIKDKIRNNAHSTAQFYSTALSAGLIVLIIMGIVVLYYYFSSKDMINIFTLFLPLVIGGGGIFGIYKNLRTWIKDKTEHAIYNEQMKYLKLDDNKRNERKIPIPSVRIADL